jgi:hypothetical protein
MRSRSFLRAILTGAIAVAAVVLAVAGFRYLAREPEPAGKFDPAEFVASRPKLDAPYVVTDYDVVDAMLAMAQVRPDDYVIDLGTGDGRIPIAAARSHGARGLGVDIDPVRIREATNNAGAAGVAHRVTFREQDLFATPLGEADVLTLYLTAEVNLRLRPRILSQMRPGARVVSHDFAMGDWRPDRRQRVDSTTIYLWVVPARAAGRWTLTADGRTATLDLRQQYQRLEGTISAGGRTSRVEQGQVGGARIRFVASLGDGRQVFEGRVAGNRIEPLQPDADWHAIRAG